MVSLRQYYLQQLGVDVWQTRPQKPKLVEPTNQEGLEALCERVSQCTRCALHTTRTQTVFARGCPQASLMIIGEAPGFHEDKQGEPFVGRAGLLLDKMLLSIGLSPQDVYIANVLKCRPPNNRDPNREEIEQCQGFLMEQIAAVNPKVILAVGRFAGQFIVNRPDSLSSLRRKTHSYQTIPVIISYHPAYLLRNPADKRKAYEDLLVVRQQLQVHL